MAELPPVPAGSPTGRFVGLILISIGILWLSLTGLCAVVTFVSMFAEGGFANIFLILIFVVPSVLIGGAFYGVGQMLRSRK